MTKAAIIFLCTPIITQLAIAQNIGIGTNTPGSKLDINGDIALRSANINIASTYTYALDVNTAKQANYRLIDTNVTAVGNFIIAGITAGADGRLISLFNRAGSSMQIFNEDATAVAANRIRTGIGGTLDVYNGGSVMLRYDAVIQKWEVINSHYSSLDYFGSPSSFWSLSGNSGTTAANFIGTTDNTPLRFKVNNVIAGAINPVNDNTSFGIYSLYNNTTGANNIAVGSYALQSNTSGANNTAIGNSTLFANTTGFKNTAVGGGALATNLNGFSNTGLGYGSLQMNTAGYENTALGVYALQNNTAGSSNSAFGSYALQSNTTGYNNTAAGIYALSINTTGYENAAMGNLALSSNSNGSWNTAIGSYSLLSNTSGNSNTGVGYEALKVNATGGSNSAFGYRSLANNRHDNAITNSGIGNTAFGSESMEDNTTGWDNAAFGDGALRHNTTGITNSAFGEYALANNNTGSSNSAFGMFALVTPHNGNRNTAVGSGSMYGPDAGDNNTMVGYGTFSQASTGSYNTGIGADAFHSLNLSNINYSTALGNISGPTSPNFVNSISIGHDSHANGSDRAEIGSTFMQLIGGYKPWTTLVSDGRFKRNVQYDVKGLDFIMQLQPVTYTVDYHALEKFKGIPSFEETLLRNDSLHKMTPAEIESVHKMQTDKEVSLKAAEATIQNGFIAQEVLKAAENCGYQFDGVNKPQHDKDNYSIAYSQFVVPLVKAVQEQQVMIEKLQQQNEELLKRINKMEKKNNLK